MNLWKQLKRRLRTRRRWLALGIFVLIAAGVTIVAGQIRQSREDGADDASAWSAFAPIVQNDDAKKLADTLAAIEREGKAREVVILKTYVCGDERQKLGILPPGGIRKLHQEHPDWPLTLEEDGTAAFHQSIDDLSPACKETAYFGIDDNGNLTLFDGEPDRDHVIRTFFQLNIHHLESSLPQDTVNHLYSGIRVGDLAEYNSVLSTFSDFAVEETQRAMNPEPNER
ncbi:BofC C-terminal domain-containing protein [Paenibacillus chartarius]|uniref:BofC C-terminal domain-containing protein n=1 Tax=Paenibacillus chartarius TaxID=747481 RepID=A0ABV6DIU4_9BACL